MCGEHDKHVCAAVLLHIERIEGLKYSKVSFPDHENRNSSAVDVLAQNGVFNLTVEHTLVESFPDQVLDGVQFVQLVGPLEQELDGRLPEGDFRLAVMIRAVAGALQGPEIRRALRSWIIENAPLLSLGQPPTNVIRARPPGVPFDIMLSRYKGNRNRLSISRSAPDNLDDLRAERVRTALDKKLPKLALARDGNTRSVLVMESNDMLNSAQDLARALSETVRPDDEIPDLIYVVETHCGIHWFVYNVRRSEAGFIPDPPEESEQGTAIDYLSRVSCGE